MHWNACQVDHSVTAMNRPVLLTLCACVLVAQSVVAAINLLIPQLAASTIHPSSTEILWTVDAYVIVFASLLIPAGALGDRYGRKGALLGGLALFAIGAAISALAGDAGVLIAGRAVSGAGAALLTPATLSIIMQLATPERRTGALAAWTLALGLGGAVGNLGGGLIGEYLDWRWLFGVLIVLAVLLVVTVALVVPRTERSQGVRPDLLGTLLVTGGLFAILYGIIEGQPYGWTSARIIGAFTLGALLFVLFAFHALRSKAPLLDVRIFRSARLDAACLGTAAGFFGLFALFFVNSQFLQGVLGFGPALAGIAILPLPAGMAISQRLATRWAAYPRAVIGGGLTLIGLGLLGASTIGADTPYWVYACWILVISMDTGLSMPALTIGVVTSLPPHQSGLGSGLSTTARELGAALGVAITATVLAGHTQLVDGLGPALRTIAVVVLASMVLVVAGYGRTRGEQPDSVADRAPASRT
nr:MFS transporter [Pseudoclavibacter chungangensis]